jgi:hypothetical protein
LPGMAEFRRRGCGQLLEVIPFARTPLFFWGAPLHWRVFSCSCGPRASHLLMNERAGGSRSGRPRRVTGVARSQRAL